jgi:hypothetical protein
VPSATVATERAAMVKPASSSPKVIRAGPRSTKPATLKRSVLGPLLSVRRMLRPRTVPHVVMASLAPVVTAPPATHNAKALVSTLNLNSKRLAQATRATSRARLVARTRINRTCVRISSRTGSTVPPAVMAATATTLLARPVLGLTS